MKKVVILLGLLISMVNLWAVPAYPGLITYEQPDGTQLQVRLRGDEYGYVYTTADNYLLRRTKQGFVYADNSQNATTILAHEAAKRNESERTFLNGLTKFQSLATAIPQREAKIKSIRQQKDIAPKNFPLKNSPKGLVILVNYKDVKFKIPNANQAFTAMLNQTGYSENGATGSVRDYFIACSDSAFQPQFDVYGPYDLPENMEYYGGEHSYGNDKNPGAMIIGACVLAHEAGVDLSQYDTDKDGVVDNVFVYYAGYNQAEGGSANSVWPHRSTVRNAEKIDGVSIYGYACTSELRGTFGTSMCGIGTFCHEFGHVLGLSDLYDTDNSEAYTVGSWDIMCSGNYNNNGRTPPSYSSFERFYLGWLTPEQITTAGTYQLEPLSENKAYLMAQTPHNLRGSNPNPKEYFLFENRQKTGWDAGIDAIAGVGMLVWHITFDNTRWSYNGPNNDGILNIDLVEAYNKKPNQTSVSDLYPGSRNVTKFQPIYNNGNKSEYPLTNISLLSNGHITFSMVGSDGQGFSFEPAELPELVSTIEKGYTAAANCAVADVKVIGKGIEPTDTVQIKTASSGIEISFDSINWATTLRLASNADSTIEQKMFVRYKPTRQSCNTVSGIISAENSFFAARLPLTYSSPNPSLVTTPKVFETTHITPYSFDINWKAQKNATYTYLTLYQIDSVRSNETQGFEDFQSIEAVKNAGWESNFTTTSTVSKIEGQRAMLFKESGEWMRSPQFLMPITELNFWISSNYTGVGDTVGGLLDVRTFNGREWHSHDVIDAKKTTKNLDKKYKFSETDSVFAIEFEYKHRAGSGGLAFDNFVVTFDKKVTYIYQNFEHDVLPADAETDTLTYTLANLQPNSRYFYQLQNSDYGNGCKENFSPLSKAICVVTTEGETSDSKQLTVVNENGIFVVYLPEPQAGHSVYVYDVFGKLVAMIPVENSLQHRVELPKLYDNSFYIVKYAETGKMKRKNQPWSKFFYHR